jgi:hypothetical protein
VATKTVAATAVMTAVEVSAPAMTTVAATTTTFLMRAHYLLPLRLLSPSEQYCIDSNGTMLSLSTLSIGALDNNGHPYADPWHKLPKKQIKPGLDLLRAEI